MNAKRVSAVVALALALAIVAQGVGRAGDAVYTKYNIHLQLQVSNKGERSYNASYSGWVDPGRDHEILPPNSKVVFEPVSRGIIDKFKPKGFRFVVVDPAAAGLKADTINFDYNAKNMAMTEEEYLRLITSPTPVVLPALSQKDREGVKGGKVDAGMTKQGVMAAFGYPAAHRTPNPETDREWIYWRDRFRTVEVYFDDKGRVERLSN